MKYTKSNKRDMISILELTYCFSIWGQSGHISNALTASTEENLR